MKNIGMGLKNCELFVDEDQSYARIYNEELGSYITWRVDIDPEELAENLKHAETGELSV